MDIDIFFSVGILHTILTYSYKFGPYLIAAFHPSPTFANDERLRDTELASKTRFPYYTRCSDKLGTLFLSSLSQSNVDKFSNFFHQVIRKKILYVYIIKISTSPVICCYTTL